MRTLISIVVCGLFLILPTKNHAQSNFSVEQYHQFLQSNKNLSSKQLMQQYHPTNYYYKSGADTFSVSNYAYLDTIIAKYKLTEAELNLLAGNQFVVTERFKFSSFGWALDNIYQKDLPVFISTDAILHALHCSYDEILMETEVTVLIPNLQKILEGLSNVYPQVRSRYGSNKSLTNILMDVDLYITVARSLLNGAKISPQFADAGAFNGIWNAIQAEKPVKGALFSQQTRTTDFSQFTVRGHYTQSATLGRYFKCMMWLSFAADFYLTAPSVPAGEIPWSKEDIHRMNLDAALINELLNAANVWELLSQNDDVITFMVGASDNVTPEQFSDILDSLGVNRVDLLLNDAKYESLRQSLATSSVTKQRILSNIFYSDTVSTDQIILPLFYRLLGQRFIVDSYIFSNVVFDRIIYENKKITRMMPDPLDILFALGNDNVPQLLKSQLETYKYSSQITTLRYLIDAYDPEFWQQSLYNTWLQAIRLLNPPADMTQYPFFMKTVAWQQEKINTQLASWAELRHDNLLYAKQSYTGAVITCSFPYGYVEPYPSFYNQIGIFAEKANNYFSQYSFGSNISKYFGNLKYCMSRLEGIAQKELEQKPLDEEEIKFLQSTLVVQPAGGCKVAAGEWITGWYAGLFYKRDDVLDEDYVVADVHTQPTDEKGNPVGRILHVGVGNINLGVFLAGAPSVDYKPMAFVGPVMSYYEKITENFKRLTDELWAADVKAKRLPVRPDWVNIYLADGAGNMLKAGRELEAGLFTSVASGQRESVPSQFNLFQNYPNPFNPTTIIRFQIPRLEDVKIKIYNILGQEVKTVINEQLSVGIHEVQWDGTDDFGQKVSSGVYIYSMETGKGYTNTRKMVFLK